MQEIDLIDGYTHEFTLSDDAMKSLEGLLSAIAKSKPAAKASAAIMDDLRGRSGILDGLDEEIEDEIEAAIKGLIEEQYGSDLSKVAITVTIGGQTVELPPVDEDVARDLIRRLNPVAA